ncbi:MAG: IS1380 family transposase [Nakamurella sp.]
MQLSQIPKVAATFDETNLIPSAGLVPVMALARRAGLAARVATKLTVPGAAGRDAAAKVSSIVAGMLTGADSIDDLDVLREGAVHKVLPGVKAPSTIGTFLRAFTFGHVRQLGAVAAGFLVALAGLVPLLTGHDDHRDAVTWLDVDDTMRETHGYQKQGVGYGYNKVKGLNALLGIVSTAVSAPIIVGHRLRQGPVSSARGAGKFLVDAIAAARRVGAGPVIRCRLDSAFYNHKVVTAIMNAKAQFSITARMDQAVQKAIAAIPEKAWVSIKYPKAIYDEEQQRWISDAQVAETTYTAFTSKGKKHRVTARLIVRRVKRLNPKAAPQGQDELFSVYRYHAVFTDSTAPMLIAEAQHRDHAIVEQVIADLKSSALKHFPSGSFNANGAWLACAVIAHNLARAAGVLAGGKLRKARTGTIRTNLINIPARVSHSARSFTLHLPVNSRREDRFITMFDAIQAPPKAA